MKFLIGSIIALLFSVSIQAQSNVASSNGQEDAPDDCMIQLSNMTEFVKIELYDYAVESWRYLFANCQDRSKSIYVYGARIYKSFLEDEDNPNRKSELLDTLMMVYDQRIKYHSEEGYVTGKKGLDLLKYDRSRLEEAYGYLSRSVNLQDSPELSVIINLINTSSQLFRERVNEGNDFLNDYFLVSDMISGMQEKEPENASYSRAAESIDRIYGSSGIATLENLDGFFSRQLEEDNTDIELLKKATELYARANLTDAPVYIRSAEILYGVEPSSEAAYHLAKIFYRQKDMNSAKKYYDEAIALSSDTDNKARLQYELAAIEFSTLNNPERARELASAAINNLPEWGDPYLLIGNIYASLSQKYGNDEFEQSTLFWASVDKYLQAISVDPTVKEEAEKLIERDRQYFPTKEDIFFHGFKEGDTYSLGSWIQEKTTVRSRTSGP